MWDYFLIRSVLILIVISYSAFATEKQIEVMAPGWGELDYLPPEPGTYDLPPLIKAGDGSILLPDGSTHQLHKMYGKGKITVLSFIYTSCSDTNGCPLATFVLHSIKKRLKQHPELSSKLRFISLSFDPLYDTPKKMSDYGKNFSSSNIEWLFVTTASTQDLNPILKAYGQYAIRVSDEKGSRTFSHTLHVYLIDQEKTIRNIYSANFLHPDILIADIKTLLLESS